MRFDEVWNEPLVERTVTYHIEVAGRLILVENVPARVNIETGRRTTRLRRWSGCSE